MLKCSVCNKEFEAKRKDAKFCSSTCRSKKLRATDNNATDKSATDNIVPVTDKPVTNNSVTDNVTDKQPKDSWLCKVEGCHLAYNPGHKGLCIYHWRKLLNMPTITKEQYNSI